MEEDRCVVHVIKDSESSLNAEDLETGDSPKAKSLEQEKQEKRNFRESFDGIGLYGTALREYKKTTNGEISLMPEERITHILFYDNNWAIGENSNGDFGKFPAAAVKVRGIGKKSLSKLMIYAVGNSDPKKNAIGFATTNMKEHGFLDLDEGELVTHDTYESSYPNRKWKCRNSDGKIGYYPYNCVIYPERSSLGNIYIPF